MSLIRSRWAAIGAAVAVSMGAGGLGIAHATITSGERTAFVPITPCRLLDTRPGADNVGPKSSPMGAGETHTVSARGSNGNCTGIPNDAVGLVLNVTALGATAPTFLTIWASDAAMPQASSLNPVPGQPPTPNAVTTDLSSGGQFNIFNLSGSVDVLADVVGYYADHNHDDRYVRLPGNQINVPLTDFTSFDAASEWGFVSYWSHNESDVAECLYAPVDLPPGRTITAARASYIAGAAVDPFRVFINKIRHTPGPAANATVTVGADAVAPAVPADTIGEVVVDQNMAYDPNANLIVFVCADDFLQLRGFKLVLA